LDWSGVITIFSAFILLVIYDHLRRYIVKRFKNTRYDKFIRDIYTEYYYYLDYITHNDDLTCRKDKEK